VNPTHVGDLDLADAGVGAAIVAHENVLKRMVSPLPGEKPPAFKALPTETYFVEDMKLSERFHGEAMQVFHMPKAHTDGDSIVWFRTSDVIATGDVFTTVSYPVIDVARGGTIDGYIAALNKIMDLAMPAFRLEKGTMIIPGHGRLCDVADVAYYRDMTTIVRDRVRDMKRLGLTLEQIKAARPTLEYDGLYGANTGANTTEAFVEAVFETVQI
jgi:glyoxylase-like metal-dependent hydrolase (beta-lactamase superfamily II)